MKRCQNGKKSNDFIAKCKNNGFLSLQNICILFKSLSLFSLKIFVLPELRDYLCATIQKTLIHILCYEA